MHKPASRIIWIGTILILLAFLTGISSRRANASAIRLPDTHPQAPKWADVEAIAEFNGINPTPLAITLPPPAEQNPCLHCHIAGEIYWEWSPITRWFVFGTMVFTFSFGISRNFIVWNRRARWHHRWMAAFSKITAGFFVLEMFTGLVLLAFSQASAPVALQILAVIQSLHWGSGIALFIAALGLSFGGALLPGFARPFWAMVFITGFAGGALGFANLSFSYLYTEWAADPLPGRPFAFHAMLIPIAIAGVVSIFFTLKNRGEAA